MIFTLHAYLTLHSATYKTLEQSLQNTQMFYYVLDKLNVNAIFYHHRVMTYTNEFRRFKHIHLIPTKSSVSTYLVLGGGV